MIHLLTNFLPISLCVLLQLPNIMLMDSKEDSSEETLDEKSQILTYVPGKLLQNNNFYKQLPSFIPDDVLPRKPTSPEIMLDTSDVTESSMENSHEDLTNIIDNLFEPQIPIPSDDYIPFVNETLSGTNCSHANFTLSCQDSFLHAPTLNETAVIKSAVLFIIAIFAYVGNIATLTSILRMGRQTTSTVYMLLVQLAIADLLVTTFCITTDAIWMLTVQWYGGNFFCKIVKFMQMFSLYLSTFVLVLIGFDRLFAVRFPMGRPRAKKDVRKGIVCIWALSALFSSPQAFIFSVMRGPFIEDFFQCVTYAFYTAAWQEQFYTTVSLVLMFLLPLFILIVTYITIFVTIANSGQENMFSERACRSPLEDARSKILHKAKIKSLMITVVIVLTFVFCWTPYYVTMIISIFFDSKIGQTLQTVVFFFGSSTAAINPLIYGAFHLKRRKPRSSKSTSLNNNSSSSRVETSLMVTLRKGRRSREESNVGHMEFSTAHHFVTQKNQCSVNETKCLFV